KSAWTSPRWDSQPAPRPPAASAPAAGCALRRDGPAPLRAAPGALGSQSARCLAPRARRARSPCARPVVRNRARARGRLVVNHRAYRDLQHHVCACPPGFIGALAVAAALRLVLGIEAEVHQRVVALAGLHDHIAALAAVSARGPAPGHKLLTAEGNNPVAARAGLHPNFRLINKHQTTASSVLRGASAHSGRALSANLLDSNDAPCETCGKKKGLSRGPSNPHSSAPLAAKL